MRRGQRTSHDINTQTEIKQDSLRLHTTKLTKLITKQNYSLLNTTDCNFAINLYHISSRRQYCCLLTLLLFICKKETVWIARLRLAKNLHCSYVHAVNQFFKVKGQVHTITKRQSAGGQSVCLVTSTLLVQKLQYVLNVHFCDGSFCRFATSYAGHVQRKA